MRNKGKDLSINVNNLTVSYNDEGPDGAPAILFIHGFPFNKSMWNKQVEALKAKYRVITYDVRGHGNTDDGKVNFSIDLFVKDLLSLMDALKIDKTILCGLSMGGYIALNAIENFPKRFDAVILCDTTCTADTPEAKEKRMKTIENIRESGVEKYADESLKKFFAPESFASNTGEIEIAREMIVKTSKESLYSTLHALAERKETCLTLPEIKLPVLILVGEKDEITTPEAAQFMHDQIKGSLLGIIEHAAHLSNMENPDQFNTQLTKFIASVNPEPGTEGQNGYEKESYEAREKELNSKILKVTMTIKDEYPELAGFLEEMPATIPSEGNVEITLKNLNAYYESLNSILNKYKLDYPKIEE